ncbi:MAG: hypothetical protein GTO40_00020, partial [Deltaproteobacteria bacterium]|nr:hypothetical protein [Deltaproteobacteria bacterium]
MSTKSDFDPLERFAGIERLAGKVYFKLSDLFLGQGELRNFWWQMAMDEEQHASVLIACKTLMDEASQQPLDPSVNAEAAHRLETKLRSYLNTPGR